MLMGINAESEHVEGAWQLLAFLLGEEAQSTIIDDIYLDRYFPVNKSVSDRIASGTFSGQIPSVQDSAPAQHNHGGDCLGYLVYYLLSKVLPSNSRKQLQSKNVNDMVESASFFTVTQN